MPLDSLAAVGITACLLKGAFNVTVENSLLCASCTFPVVVPNLNANNPRFLSVTSPYDVTAIPRSRRSAFGPAAQRRRMSQTVAVPVAAIVGVSMGATSVTCGAESRTMPAAMQSTRSVGVATYSSGALCHQLKRALVLRLVILLSWA